MARKDLYVVFELVVFFKKNHIELQMSCGWAMLSLRQIVQDGAHTLQLMGGSPLSNMSILPDDVRAGRGTLFGKVGKWMSGVKS